MEVAYFIFIVAPVLGIAGWLSFLFIRKRHYERGVVVFLSTTLVPLLAWYFTTWVRDVSPIWRLLDQLPGGLWEFLPGLAMIGAFVWLCIHWARQGQSLEERARAEGPSSNLPSPESQPDGVRERLEMLQRLKADGLISDEEYAAKRSEILANI